MEGILEGLLYVTGDEGLSLKDVMTILNLNEEQVKKDLALISTIPGKPKSGRNIND